MVGVTGFGVGNGFLRFRFGKEVWKSVGEHLCVKGVKWKKGDRTCYEGYS